jgi:hypothetical protein
MLHTLLDQFVFLLTVMTYWVYNCYVSSFGLEVVQVDASDKVSGDFA